MLAFARGPFPGSACQWAESGLKGGGGGIRFRHKSGGGGIRTHETPVGI
jgi:hypothetical protein